MSRICDDGYACLAPNCSCENKPPRLTRESTADCVVKVLVRAENVNLFDKEGVGLVGVVRLVPKDDGYVLEIEKAWPDAR